MHMEGSRVINMQGAKATKSVTFLSHSSPKELLSNAADELGESLSLSFSDPDGLHQHSSVESGAVRCDKIDTNHGSQQPVFPGTKCSFGHWAAGRSGYSSCFPAEPVCHLHWIRKALDIKEL